MTNNARKAIVTAEAYRQAFASPAGKVVLEDLLKKHLLADPVVIDDPQATAVNIGMQRLAVQLVKKAYRTEQALRVAIERTLEQDENP